MTDIENLELSISSLNVYPIEPNIIKDMLRLLKNIESEYKKVSRVELPVKPASGGQTGNEPIDDTFIYKIVLQDTVIDEQKEKRFVLARNFDDATQLASEMCEGNDWCVIRIKEIGYLDYCTGVIVKYFSRLSV